MVEVDGNQDNPKFTVKRISRGNEHNFRKNEQTDKITIYKNGQRPDSPKIVSPQNTKISSVGGILKAINSKVILKVPPTPPPTGK